MDRKWEWSCPAAEARKWEGVTRFLCRCCTFYQSSDEFNIQLSFFFKNSSKFAGSLPFYRRKLRIADSAKQRHENMFWNLGWLGRQQPWNSAVVLVGRISWKGCFSCWCILALFVFCDTGVLFLIASLVNWCSLEWNSVDSSCSVNKSYNTRPNTILLHIPQICSQSKWVSSNVGPFCLLLWFFCKNITCIALIGVINFLEYLNNLFMENFLYHA